MPEISKFLGIFNRDDPKRLPLGAMLSALNTDIDDTLNARRRPGYTKSFNASNITSSYQNFVIDNGDLKNVITDQTLSSGFGLDRYLWCYDGNKIIIYGHKKGYIENGVFHDLVIPLCPPVQTVTGIFGSFKYVVAVYKNSDGLIGGASAPVEVPIGTNYSVPNSPGMTTLYYESIENGQNLYLNDSIEFEEGLIGSFPVPENGVQIATHQAQLLVAEYLRAENKTVIWFSHPFSYHLFDKSEDYLVIPGKCTALISIDAVLIIGTENSIYAYREKVLTALANYGMPSGNAYAETKSKTRLAMTNGGVCQLNPFKNLTQEKIDMNSSAFATAQVVESNGYEKFIAVMSGVKPPNNNFRS